MSGRRGYRLLAPVVVLAAIAALGPAGCGSDPAVPEAPGAATADAWRLVTPRPFPVTINAMWADPVTLRTMAVGDYGALLVKEGSTWRQAPPPTTESLYDIHGCDWEHIYVVAAGGLYRFDGRRWSRTGPGPLDEGTRVWCRAPDDVMVATRNGVTFHYDGASWTQGDMGADGASGHWLTETRDGYLAVSRDEVMVRWTAGHWDSPIALGDGSGRPVAVCHYDDRWDDEEYFLIATAYGVLYSSDGRRDWYESDLGARILDLAGGSWDAYALTGEDDGCHVVGVFEQDLATIRGHDTGTLLVVPQPGDSTDDLVFGGGFGTIFAGLYGSVHRPDGPILTRIAGGVPIRPGPLLVLPSGGFFGWNLSTRAVLRGRADVVDSVGTGGSLVRTVAGTDPDAVYALASGGGVLRLRADGSHEPVALPDGIAVSSLWCEPGGALWVYGGGDVWRRDGSVWSRMFAPPLDYRLEIRATGPDDAYVVGYNGVDHWDGHELIEVVSERAYPGYGVTLAPDGSGVCCLVDATVGGVAVRPVIVIAGPRESRRIAAMPRFGTWLALGTDGAPLVVEQGMLSHWHDGGWESIPHPATAAGIPIESIAGNPTGGYYTVAGSGVIHYLDTGGTGLWQ